MLDLSKKQRKSWPVILADGTRLDIPQPPAALVYSLQSMEQTIDDMIDGVTAILNTNKQGEDFSREEVMDAFEVGDLTDFLNGYYEFVYGIYSDPNSKSRPAQQSKTGKKYTTRS